VSIKSNEKLVEWRIWLIEMDVPPVKLIIIIVIFY
jgi:hypothetical protein